MKITVVGALVIVAVAIAVLLLIRHLNEGHTPQPGSETSLT
jgi:hypothetical protein